MNSAWYETAAGRYYGYIKATVDATLAPHGLLSVCQTGACSPENGLLASQVLRLYQVTQDPRYYHMAAELMRQFAPRMGNGPVDLYAAAPFVAAYASVFWEPQVLQAVTRQLVLTDRRLCEAEASDPSAARELARYMTALTDALPYYPAQNRGRAQLLAMLRRTATEAARYQNFGIAPLSRNAKKRSLDPSSASLLVYALAKATRLGYLPRQYASNASDIWRRLGTGKAFWINPGATGAYLLAESEMQLQSRAALGRGMKVTVDAWYNSEARKNAAGQTVLFHYKWNDYSNSGFSIFGHIFRIYGMQTATLDSAPTLAGLRGSQFYIIVSPDNKNKNSNPHFMNAEDARRIEAWVRSGGVLLLMENDPANADIPHLDILADTFGLHFNNRLTHHVLGDDFRMGRIEVHQPQPLFTNPHLLYMKDTCSLSLSKGATALLRYKGDTLMAVAHYGEGTVFAVADPWLYNEYTDGRKLPAEYDNFAAGEELVGWLLRRRRRFLRKP